MRAVRHRSVPHPVRAHLLAGLPPAEFAVSVLDRADGCIEVTGEGGGPVASALLVVGDGSLSGAETVAACAGSGTGATELARGLLPLLTEAGQLELAGPATVTLAAARDLARLAAAPMRTVMDQRLMVATTAVPPPGVPGAGGPLAGEDHTAVAAWFDAFAVEALDAEPRGRGHWIAWLADPRRRPWVWTVDGAAVSLVVARATTPVSSRLGPVYTPPEHRGNGYAAALTAHVTGALLARGDERVTLFTDETNATSNALYERVGFVDVAAHGSWAVTRS